MTAVAILGLCFIFVWSMFSSSSSSVTTRIESFDNIGKSPGSKSTRASTPSGTHQVASNGGEEKRANDSAVSSPAHEHKYEKEKKEAVNGKTGKGKKKLPESVAKGKNVTLESENEDSEIEKEDGDEEKEVVDGKEEALGDESEGNGEAGGEGDNLMEMMDKESEEVKLEDDGGESEKRGKKKYKMKGPLFDPKAHYSWKQCSTRSKHNYIPCIDMEVGSGRLQYRHTERSCPKVEPMCLVPLPRDGYGPPVPWPESKEKILYKNVEHPKLAAFIKEHSWVMKSGEYLTFPQNQSELKGGILHYLESIEEMVPDIEWGKNIRVVLDIGCTDSAFGASLVDKDVLTLALGLKDDLVDLAQVALERGFPALVSHFQNRRLPFPSGVFDAVHCGGCTIPWHSNGGKHLLEMNRILRPGGYFVLSTKHASFEEEEAESFDGSDEEDEEEEDGGESGVVDLEDIAGKGPSRRNPVAATKTNGTVNGKKEMVTPVIRASLTKQGYKIIGSHSGVKICRWTKSQLRGRGGVTLERLTEGLSPRHCALSLVGEPIMYPEINALIDELHRRRISTFLVTNAQFPEKIKMLNPITQLYVSVDAATKESLKAIDRPLFGDFWERFIDSLTSLKDKQQRTVYRLTLVKGWNTKDIDAYYNIFDLGNPDFVEIKGVTYCGTSATSKLTMENVPWHADVKAFSEALALKSNGEYEVACEHVHSCCVLLAKTSKFKIDGQWFTWIDYEKFHDLVASGKHFDSTDYMAPTPSWAVYGAEEGGFDPYQSRYKKERHHRTNQ
ncbi:hypothetical protein C1H46_024292 [Malus baccata]|uniref:tRNA 4-demethylwyosine synthase (AdoMet-dependent) n=1 Tax=Malus baccata TaxID=106549 RepID=A0A540LUR4_MALBA|nr:hypothetical protein C1H46_024292 [Malus baccata]